MTDLEDAVDLALYDEDPVVRDSARSRLTQRADGRTVAVMCALLDSPSRTTRRRASRILSAMRPELTTRLLTERLLDASGATPVRVRTGAARLLMILSSGEVEALGLALKDAERRVRRAAANVAAPVHALIEALDDDAPEVVSEALNALQERGCEVPYAALEAACLRLASAGPLPAALTRARLTAAPEGLVIRTAALSGDDVALDHLTSVDGWRALLGGDHHVDAVWGLVSRGLNDPSWVASADPRVRAAFARALPPDDERHDLLHRDPSAVVRWFSRQARAGSFVDAALEARLGKHALSDATSARPPFGLTAADRPEAPPRVAAALALCHPRLDVNLGVAVRSAEAAGLSEVFVVGRAELLRSPARGTENVLTVTHLQDAAALIRRAHALDYQLVVIQQTPLSAPYHQAEYPPRPLFVVGAEDEGVPQPLRRAADLLVEIPQYGLIDSLNVAAAATVVMFHWRTHI
ncbi:MAG: hypothetical protein EXR76_10205 [Myxococcales bacterium]|nr:hypothetical protein [Myxococcales bacterium]